MIRTAIVVPLALLMLSGCQGNPAGVSYDGYTIEHRTLYVVNGLSETLSAVDVEEGTVHNNIVELGKWPNDLALSPAGDKLYVVDSGDNQVQEIAVETGTTERLIDIGVGRNPWACEVLGGDLWVSNFLTGEAVVAELAGGAISRVIPAGNTLEAIWGDSDAVYVTDTNFQYGSFGPGQVVKIDRNSGGVIGSVQVGTNPQDLLLDALGRLQVLCTGTYAVGQGREEGEVYLVDPTGLASIDTLYLGGSPSAMCAGDGGVIYITGYWGGVMAYDASTLEVLNGFTSPLLAGEGYTDIEYDPFSGLLYVADFEEDRVIALDPVSGEVVADFGVGDGPLRVLLVEPQKGAM